MSHHTAHDHGPATVEPPAATPTIGPATVTREPDGCVAVSVAKPAVAGDAPLSHAQMLARAGQQPPPQEWFEEDPSDLRRPPV